MSEKMTAQQAREGRLDRTFLCYFCGAEDGARVRKLELMDNIDGKAAFQVQCSECHAHGPLIIVDVSSIIEDQAFEDLYSKVVDNFFSPMFAMFRQPARIRSLHKVVLGKLNRSFVSARMKEVAEEIVMMFVRQFQTDYSETVGQAVGDPVIYTRDDEVKTAAEVRAEAGKDRT